VRSVPNSGAPRGSVPSGSGEPARISAVQPTSSSIGRLSCRLRCPATREAITVSTTRPPMAATMTTRIERAAR
jgi:hypothetical protein